MAYSNNPNLPRVRMEAVRLVRKGWSTVKVARHLGYAQGTISKWCKRAPHDRRARIIPTRSSRPHSHPKELDESLVCRIIDLRKERNQCAEILHHRLMKEGVSVSLSSVKRTLKREGLIYPSKWKRWHTYPPKPLPSAPGILIQIDSMQEGLAKEGLRAYALVDVCSRWAWATACPKVNTHLSLRFVEEARKRAPFSFSVIQSDHGPEFSKWLTKRLGERSMSHRHSRVRRPTDNAHVERFILTLQRDCLKRTCSSLKSWRREIPLFLRWYNHERPHMSLGMRTPNEKIAELFQAID